MNPNHDHTPTRADAVKIAAVYAVLGALWILCTGRLLHHFVHDGFWLEKLEAVKGWFYVLVTAVLLGWWLNRYFREIRRSTELLQKSEARFVTIFRHSSAPVAVTRISDGVFVDANEAFARLYGHPLEKIIGRTSEELQLWHSGNRVQVIAELQEKGRTLVKIQGRRKNGDVLDLLASLQLIELDGEPCIMGTLVDVTERIKAEAALREGEERLQFALESCHIGAWDMNLADHTAFRSPEHARIFGYEQLQPIWTREIFMEHVLPEDRGAVSQKIQHAIQTQSHFNFECRIRRVDGQIRWIWVAGRYRADSGGEKRLAGIVQDITERKAREAEIERLSRLYAALSQINQAIVRLNSYEELTREIPRIAVEFGGFKIAWVGRYNLQTLEITPLGWAGEQWETVRNFRHSLEDRTGQACLCGPVIRENRSCVLNDLSAVTEMSNWLMRVEQAGIRAAAVFPVRVRDTVWGVFGVYDSEPDVFRDKEIALMEEAAMDIGYAIEHIENEAQRRQAEKFQLLSASILGVLNEPLTLREAGSAILGLIKRETGLDAVGIRLKDGDDFPYFTAEGFDKEFLLAENSVILRNEIGAACRDADGRLSLQCTCGMVLAEKCGPPGDHVTPAGSIWTNDSLALLNSLNGHDLRVEPRNRCTHEGFMSVALIPVRVDRQIIGLLHLNDRRKDRFTPETIRFFEGLTASFGIAVKRRKAESALKTAHEKMLTILDSIDSTVYVADMDTHEILFMNQKMITDFGGDKTGEKCFKAFRKQQAPVIAAPMINWSMKTGSRPASAPGMIKIRLPAGIISITTGPLNGRTGVWSGCRSPWILQI
nr:PAS domain S-box protein [Desulfobacula sp.]